MKPSEILSIIEGYVSFLSIDINHFYDIDISGRNVRLQGKYLSEIAEALRAVDLEIEVNKSGYVVATTKIEIGADDVPIYLDVTLT